MTAPTNFGCMHSRLVQAQAPSSPTFDTGANLAVTALEALTPAEFQSSWHVADSPEMALLSTCGCPPAKEAPLAPPATATSPTSEGYQNSAADTRRGLAPGSRS